LITGSLTLREGLGSPVFRSSFLLAQSPPMPKPPSASPVMLWSFLLPVVGGAPFLASGDLSGQLPADAPEVAAAHTPDLAAADTPDVAADTLAVVLGDTLHVVGTRVSADLPQRTRAVQILDRAELSASPARNAVELLRWVTGAELGARSRAQADLSIRGAGFEQTLILVDGVRMNDPQTGHFNLDLALPLDEVERIEILRGPASSLYGSDAVGGVVNLVTRQGTGWNLRAEGGSFGSLGLAGGGALALPGRARLRLSGEWDRTDGHRPGTDAESLLGQANLRAPVAGGELRAQAGVGDRAFGARDFYAPFDSFEETRTLTLGAGWRSDPSRRVVVEPRLDWRRHSDDFLLERDNPQGFRNVHTSQRWGGEVTLRTRPHPGLGVAMGGGAWRESLESTGLGEREEGRQALFGEADLALPGNLRSAWGLRMDRHELWGTSLSPSLALAWDVRTGVRLRASASDAFRGPTWTERHYTDPAHRARADLDPERSRSVEAGLRLEGAGGAHADITAFRRSSRDLIDWARPAAVPDAPWETLNLSRAVFRGLEVEGGWTPLQGTRLRAGLSLLSLDVTAPVELRSKYALRPLTEQFTLTVDQTVGQRLTLSLRGVHGRRPGESHWRDVDVRLDLPLAGVRWHLDIRNLLGSQHPDLTGNPVPGRAAYLGLRLAGP